MQKNLRNNKQYKRGKRIVTVGACALILIAGGLGLYEYRNSGNNKPTTVAVRHHRQRPNYISTAQLPFSAPRTTQGFHNSAKAALVMNDNGQVQYGKNIDQLRKVASTGKLMTLYLAQSKANKTHGWNDKITVPPKIAYMSRDAKDQTGAELHLKANHQYTVSELYQSALVESSNAAAVLLGNWVGGTNANFVQMMNQQAKAWHLNASFISSSGLENDSISKFGLKVAGGKSSGNMLSAKDLAVIAQHLLKDFPQVTKWSSLPSDKVCGVTMSNVNSDLPGQAHSTPGCDGLKTGYTSSAGYCFVGTKKLGNGHHRIIVLLDDPQLFTDGHALLQGHGTAIKSKARAKRPRKISHMARKMNRSKRKAKIPRKHKNIKQRMHRKYRRLNRKQKKNF